MPVNFKELNGTKLVFDENLMAETPTQKIKFASKQRIGGREIVVPHFRFEEKTNLDPDIALTGRVPQISSLKIKTKESSKFIAAIKEEFESGKVKNYLFPNQKTLLARMRPEDRSNGAYMQISGERIDKYFKEIEILLITSFGMSTDEKRICEREIAFMRRSATRELTYSFDRADTNTYWSRSKDKVFVHVFEKMLAALKPTDPMRPVLQKEVDYLLTYQYAGESGWVKQSDIENSLGLMAISQSSRHIVSMTSGTKDSTGVLEYETLKFPENHFCKFKGQHVYYDGKNYYLESTHEKVSPRLAPGIVRDKLVDSVVFRRLSAKESEKNILRENFKYDWMGNGYIDPEDQDASWWGSCEVRAIHQAKLLDLKKSGGVVEYNIDTNRQTQYSRADILEISAGLLDFGKNMAGPRGGKAKPLGAYDDAGETYEARPEDLEFTLKLGGRTKKVSLPCVLKKVGGSKALEELFSKKTPGSTT